MRAHIRKPPSTRRSRKKRLLTLLTSRLFIIVVLILFQLFLLLFTLVELGTRQYPQLFDGALDFAAGGQPFL